MLFGVERFLFLSSRTYIIHGVVLHAVTSPPAREVQIGIKKVNVQEKKPALNMMQGSRFSD